MLAFCGVFLKRYAEVELWEGDLCVTETEHVDKFLEMLQRREAELKSLNATSVEQLFSGHRKKSDADLRFGYDFVRPAGPATFCGPGGTNAGEVHPRTEIVCRRDCVGRPAAETQIAQKFTTVVRQ